MKQDISTKQLILGTALEMFARSGFDQTRISDISASVGISDSTIYEHYRNKEDILLTILQERARSLIRTNELHLRGLQGAEVKLRKLTWNYLEFMFENRDFTSLYLLELRHNRSIYEGDSFEITREFTKMFGDVIREGQKTGEFVPSIAPFLVLNMIFGTIDHILLTWLIMNNPEAPMECFEPMFRVLIRAIRARGADQRTDDKRRRILEAGSTVFAEMGYKGARIQDVAKLAGVADGTIYQHFKNKQELLFAIPVENTNELISIMEEHLSGPSDPNLKLSILVTEYLKYLDSKKEYASVVLFGLRYNKNFYKTNGYDHFRKFARMFYDTIRDGQEKGVYDTNCDPYLVVKMIFGVIDHSMLSLLMFRRPDCILSLTNTLQEIIRNALTE